MKSERNISTRYCNNGIDNCILISSLMLLLIALTAHMNLSKNWTWVTVVRVHQLETLSHQSSNTKPVQSSMLIRQTSKTLLRSLWQHLITNVKKINHCMFMLAPFHMKQLLKKLISLYLSNHSLLSGTLKAICFALPVTRVSP